MIRNVKKEVTTIFPLEAYQVYSIANSQSLLDGDMAEVGVFQGGTAKIICEAKGGKTLHLFDTFSGLPPLSDSDSHFGLKVWKEGHFNKTTEENVRKYLANYENVKIYKGFFPHTAGSVDTTKFSFVHLDVDLYESTLACLFFFYERLIPGGIILTHDYHTTGVRRAFDEFFKEIKTPVIDLTSSQCMAIKID